MSSSFQVVECRRLLLQAPHCHHTCTLCNVCSAVICQVVWWLTEKIIPSSSFKSPLKTHVFQKAVLQHLYISIYFFISNGILILADCSIFYNSNENNHLFGLFQMVNKMKFSLNYRSSTELLYCTLTVNYWSLFRNMRLYDPLLYFFS